MSKHWKGRERQGDELRVKGEVGGNRGGLDVKGVEGRKRGGNRKPDKTKRAKGREN